MRLPSASLGQPFGWFLLALLLLVSCRAPSPSGPVRPERLPRLTLGQTNESLLQPHKFDWSSQRVSAPAVQEARQSWFKQAQPAPGLWPFRLQSWPQATPAWRSPGQSYPGVSLAALSQTASLSGLALSADDTLPNSPASTFLTQAPSRELTDRVFFLTRQGRLLKLKRDDPLDTPRGINLNNTFSRTYITLSPRCGRAYCLADDGTLYVVDTTGAMRLQATGDIGVAGGTHEGYGLAAALDPLMSSHDDALDTLFVPRNDGQVQQYLVQPGTSSLVPQATHMVTNAAPIANAQYNPSNHRLMAPCVALGGTLLLGDTAGRFIRHDTRNPANCQQIPVSLSAIEAPPAIEIQDGSYSGLTDRLGQPANVALYAPLYAFVNVTQKNGPVCAWIDLLSEAVWYSRPLFLDDHDSDPHGDWFAYDYLASDVTRYVAAEDSLNVADDYLTPLPGASVAFSQDVVAPALANVAIATGSVSHFSTGTSPPDVAFDKNGKLYVTNDNGLSNGFVRRYNQSGTLEKTFTVRKNPRGLAYHPLGDAVWVANFGESTAVAAGLERLNVFFPNTGSCTSCTTTSATRINHNAVDVAVDPDGVVWYAHAKNDDMHENIRKLDASATVSAATLPGGSRDIPTDAPGLAIAADPNGGAVWETLSDPNLQLARVDTALLTVSHFADLLPGETPGALAVGLDGTVWVAYPEADRVRQFAYQAGSLTTLADYQVNACKGLVVDNSGAVWATSGDGNVKRINQGRIDLSIATQSDPRGIAVGVGRLAIANTGANSVTQVGTNSSVGVRSLLRFLDSACDQVATGSTLVSATLGLRTNGRSTSCYPPEVYRLGRPLREGASGAFEAGGTTPWSSQRGLTASQAPAFTENLGALTGSANAISGFTANTPYSLDVTRGMAQTVPVPHHAFGLRYDATVTGTDQIYWRGGPFQAFTSGSTPPLFAPQFSAAGSASGVAGPSDSRPLLTLRYKRHLNPPLAPVATAPIIDVSNGRRRVYVFNTNTLFSLDFTTPQTWCDTAYSTATLSGTRYTRFNTARLGRLSENGGATLDGGSQYVRNTTTPVVNSDLSAIYVLSQRPSGGSSSAESFDYALSKFSLPLDQTTSADRMVADGPSTTVSNSFSQGALNSEGGSPVLLLDPFAASGTSGEGLYVGLDGAHSLFRFAH